VLKSSSISLQCKYGFFESKPWKLGKNWMISNLKLKWDTPGGKTIHNSASVLVGFKSPTYDNCEMTSNLLQPCFLKNIKIS
jgi:hypothetical protein